MTTVWPYEVMTSIQFATFYTRCLQTTPPLSTLRMFCWPCISIQTYNENQLDPLFVLSLFRQSTSTYFGHICTPSSGGTLYIYNTYQLLYMYSIPPDDGLQICPKLVEFDWRNKLRIKLNFHQVGFNYTHASRCTVNNTLNLSVLIAHIHASMFLRHPRGLSYYVC